MEGRTAEEEAKIKAEARAYALGESMTTTTTKGGGSGNSNSGSGRNNNNSKNQGSGGNRNNQRKRNNRGSLLMNQSEGRINNNDNDDDENNVDGDRDDPDTVEGGTGWVPYGGAAATGAVPPSQRPTKRTKTHGVVGGVPSKGTTITSSSSGATTRSRTTTMSTPNSVTAAGVSHDNTHPPPHGASRLPSNHPTSVGGPATRKSSSSSSSSSSSGPQQPQHEHQHRQDDQQGGNTNTHATSQTAHVMISPDITTAPTTSAAATAAAAAATETVGGRGSGNRSYTNTNVLFDDDDDEYVRMIKSLGLDDFQIFEKLVLEDGKDDDDDDDEYDVRLSDLDDDDDQYMVDDDDDDDDNDDGNDDGDNNDHVDTDDDADVDRNDGDDSQALDADEVDGGNDIRSNPATTGTTAVKGKKKKTSTPSKRPSFASPRSNPKLTSPASAGAPDSPMTIPDLESEDAFYRDLEEELGSLVEEDMEAAVQSLYFNHHLHNHAIDENDLRDGTTNGTIQHYPQHPHASRMTKPTGVGPEAAISSSMTQSLISNANSVTVGSKSGPVTAATIAAANRKRAEETAASSSAMTGVNAETKSKGQKRSSKSKLMSDEDGNIPTAEDAPETPLRDAARQGPAARVTYRQSQQLRKLLQQHYQLLIQQAILSIRAAQWQKTGFLAAVATDPPGSSVISGSATIPTTNNPADAKSGTGQDASAIPKPVAAAAAAAAAPNLFSNSRASYQKSDFLCGETADDLVEILDGAVGMLQDLDQNRKDAIRTSIQLAMSGGGGVVDGERKGINQHRPNEDNDGDNLREDGDDDVSTSLKGRRSLLDQFSQDHDVDKAGQKESNQGDRRLTRAAFKRLQAQPIAGSKRTAFDIPGLLKLKETFSTIDRSVNNSSGSDVEMGKENTQNAGDVSIGSDTSSTNILQAATHANACRIVLKQAGAHVDESLLPGVTDLSDNFSRVQEYLDESFQPPCNEQQAQFLRKNRNLFTSGEDNLVLRGVNLYGEKQWILIADRYLPDRSVNIISQRYSKLCVMLYKANGIHIDSKGNLLEPPKLESVDDIDESKVHALGLKLVEPPAILNVHRWSLEEDLTLLKAVPIMGHMWAELGARLIPHRDRGHLRKRYQVLERRVKATTTRSTKKELKSSSVSKYQKAAPRKTTTPAVAARPPISKLNANNRGLVTHGTAGEAKVEPLFSGACAGRAKTLAVSMISHTQNAKRTEALKPTKTPKRAVKTGNMRTEGVSAVPTTGVRALNDSNKHQMSIENAAASLAFMKPKENQMQSKLQSTAAVLDNIRKGPSLHHDAKTESLAKSTASKRKSKTPAEARNSTASSIEPLPTYKAPVDVPAAASRPLEAPGSRHFRYHNGLPKQAPELAPDNRIIQNGVVGPPRHSTQQTITSSTSYPINAQISTPWGAPNVAHGSKVAKAKTATPADHSTPHCGDIDSSIATYAGGYADASRLAFEKLIDGSSEWSQLSRVKQMMENDDENEVANAIVDHLAKSTSRAPTHTPSKLPSTLDANSNMTGLSILNEVSRQAPLLSGHTTTSNTLRQESMESGLSIMARVLERTSDNAQCVSEDKTVSDYNRSIAAMRTAHAAAKVATESSSLQTPTKPHGFFSTSGTPTGLSPGFPSPTIALGNGVGATNFSVPFSPAPSTIMRDFDEKTDANGLLHEFHLQSDSIKDMEVLGRVGEPYDPNPPNLPETPSKHSLLIAPDDFEAVSALEALSNSPFRPSIQSNQETRENRGETKSLFAKVIGGINSKGAKTESPQKRLQF